MIDNYELKTILYLYTPIKDIMKIKLHTNSINDEVENSLHMTVNEFAKSKYTCHSEQYNNTDITMTKVNNMITVGIASTETHKIISITNYTYDGNGITMLDCIDSSSNTVTKVNDSNINITQY